MISSANPCWNHDENPYFLTRRQQKMQSPMMELHFFFFGMKKRLLSAASSFELIIFFQGQVIDDKRLDVLGDGLVLSHQLPLL